MKIAKMLGIVTVLAAANIASAAPIWVKVLDVYRIHAVGDDAENDQYIMRYAYRGVVYEEDVAEIPHYEEPPSGLPKGMPDTFYYTMSDVKIDTNGTERNVRIFEILPDRTETKSTLSKVHIVRDRNHRPITKPCDCVRTRRQQSGNLCITDEQYSVKYYWSLPNLMECPYDVSNTVKITL